MKTMAIILGIFLMLGGVVYAEELTDWEKNHKAKALEIENKRLDFEREKWEWDRSEKKRAEYEGQFSSYCDIKREIPLIKIYSSLSDTDRRNLRNDLTILNEQGCKHVVINMNTGGGSAFTGLGLADVINDFKKSGMVIEIQAEGIIASAAVPVFAVGSIRKCTPNTIFMVHEASIWSFSFGYSSESHSDIKAKDRMMDTLRGRYLGLLADHTNRDLDFWAGLEEDTTWFTAKQAQEWGLVDIIK